MLKKILALTLAVVALGASTAHAKDLGCSGFARLEGVVKSVNKEENSTTIRIVAQKDKEIVYGGVYAEDLNDNELYLYNDSFERSNEVYDIFLTDDTLILNNEGTTTVNGINNGDKLVVKYCMDMPMAAIWPARITPTAVLVNDDTNAHLNMYVGKFTKSDGHYVNDRFRIPTEGTRIVDVNGKAYKGSIAGKEIAIVYGAATRSMPAIPIDPLVIVMGNAHKVAPAVKPNEVKESESMKETDGVINMLDFLPPFARGTKGINWGKVYQIVGYYVPQVNYNSFSR